jgi:hypothetical protein
MYLIFGSSLVGYLSFVKTMATAFAMILGKVNGEEIMKVQPIMGPMIMAAFNLMVIIFALNIFISIIVDAFEVVRAQTLFTRNDFDVIGYAWSFMERIFGKKLANEKEIVHSPDMYKDHLSILPNRIQKLVNYYKRVRQN